MMLVPLGPGEEGRAQLAGTGMQKRRDSPTPAGSSLTLVSLCLPCWGGCGQGVVNAAVFACPVWLTDALAFVAADLEVGLGQ